MITIIFLLLMLVAFIYTYREIKRLDELLDKLFCQFEQLDEIKTDINPSQFYKPIENFNPEKVETLRPNTLQAREVDSQVFEFDVKKDDK